VKHLYEITKGTLLARMSNFSAVLKALEMVEVETPLAARFPLIPQANHQKFLIRNPF